MTRLLALSFTLVTCTGCLAFHRGAVTEEKTHLGEYMELPDARVRYTDNSIGISTLPPVVMIHGFGASLETWAGVAPLIGKTRRVITLDLKGFGGTDRPEGDYSPPAQARLVLALLEKLGVTGKFALVAHSWGSSVALQLALAVPERVTRIALYDAWVYEEQLPTMFYWARAPIVGEILFGLYYDQMQEYKLAAAFYDKKYVTQQMVDDVERVLAFPGTNAAALATVRGMRYTEVQKEYGKIKQPVILMYGREDMATPVSFGERLAQQLPNATLEVYPRCGHLSMVEAYAATSAKVLKFLGEDK
ncbi:MAG TPA: alpha/beta hydrolase [Myxococcales bacterium]